MQVRRMRPLLMLAALCLGGCSSASFLAVNVPATFEHYQRTRDVPYGDGARQRLDVYRPRAAASTPTPVIVFLHGGRWRFGNKEQYRFVGAALAGRGFLAVLPNYRLYPQVKLDGFADDVARAVAWARVLTISCLSRTMTCATCSVRRSVTRSRSRSPSCGPARRRCC